VTHSGPRSKEGRGHTSRNGGITPREVIYAQEALRDLCVRVAVLEPEAEHNRSEERALDAFLAGLARIYCQTADSVGPRDGQHCETAL
jgi:hypothetical protein